MSFWQRKDPYPICGKPIPEGQLASFQLSSGIVGLSTDGPYLSATISFARNFVCTNRKGHVEGHMFFVEGGLVDWSTE